MRIIGGTYRSRKIIAPEGLATRPMTDRVRENLFNLLGQDLTGVIVLDLFCGSGALGLEALSRGATHVTFVDTDPAAIEAVNANCRTLGITAPIRILRRDCLRPGPWICPPAPRGGRYTHIFIDPPYQMTADPQGQSQLATMVRALVDLGCVAPGAVAMIRTERGTPAKIPLPWDGWDLADERSYGTTTLHLVTCRGPASSEK